jgi:putative transposase
MKALPPTGEQTGVDLGIEAFATLADGAQIFHPGWYRKAEHALKMAHRRVSRRKKGGNRRQKAVTLIAKARSKVKRQPDGFHYTVALHLRQSTDVIDHGAVRTANMLRNRHLAKSIRDAGWSQFLTLLQCSVRRSETGRCAAGVRAASVREVDVLWLRHAGRPRRIGSLALLPGG